MPTAPRRAGLARTLSFWCPGLGQIYAAAPWRGTLILATSGILTEVAFTQWPPSAMWGCEWPVDPTRVLVVWGAALALWLWNIGDATRAERDFLSGGGPTR